MTQQQLEEMTSDFLFSLAGKTQNDRELTEVLLSLGGLVMAFYVEFVKDLRRRRVTP